jgi:hypothetical protein
MFQINCKLKSLLYIVFGVFRLKIFFIQKHITKRSRVEIDANDTDTFLRLGYFLMSKKTIKESYSWSQKNLHCSLCF